MKNFTYLLGIILKEKSNDPDFILEKIYTLIFMQKYEIALDLIEYYLEANGNVLSNLNIEVSRLPKYLKEINCKDIKFMYYSGHEEENIINVLIQSFGERSILILENLMIDSIDSHIEFKDALRSGKIILLKNVFFQVFSKIFSTL